MTEVESIKGKLLDLEKEFEQRRREITQSAERELLAAIDAAKGHVKKLEDEYAKLIGKAPKQLKGTGKRQRLTREEQDAARQRLSDFLRSKPEGARMKELVAAGQVNAVSVRRLLGQLEGLRTEGARATMIYKLS